MATQRFIDIFVRSKKAEADVKSLDKAMVKLGRDTDKTTKSMGQLTKVAQGVSAALITRQVVQYADAYTSVQNQIRQTVNSTEELTKRTQQLLDVSNRSRVGLSETVDLYTNLTLSTKSLNLSAEENLRITETISKSFAVSGKTAAESAGAIRQLGQALSAGALRGDEFNSIAEGAPEIMRALQRELNLTQGELRDFAATGGITAEIVVTSLQKAADVIDKKLANSVKTFAQSAETANNNLTAFIGSSTEVQSVMGAAGSILVKVSENLDTITNVAIALTAVFTARLLPSISAITAAVIAGTNAALVSARATQTEVAASVASAKAKQAETAATLALATAKAKEANAALFTAQSTTAATAAKVKANKANEVETKAKRADVAANAAVVASTANLTAANRGVAAASTLAARAVGGLRTALSFLGGPVGVALLAAQGLFIFRKELGFVSEATGLTDKATKDLLKTYSKFTTEEVDQEFERLNTTTSKFFERSKNLTDEIKRIKAEIKNVGTLDLAPQQKVGVAQNLLSNLKATQQELDATTVLLDTLKKKQDTLLAATGGVTPTIEPEDTVVTDSADFTVIQQDLERQAKLIEEAAKRRRDVNNGVISQEVADAEEAFKAKSTAEEEAFSESLEKSKANNDEKRRLQIQFDNLTAANLTAHKNNLKAIESGQVEEKKKEDEDRKKDFLNLQNNLKLETKLITDGLLARSLVKEGIISQEVATENLRNSEAIERRKLAHEERLQQDKLEDEEKKALQDEFDEREKAEKKVHEETLAQIGIDATKRENLEKKKAADQYKLAAINLGAGLLKLNISNNAKSEKEQKRARKIGVIIDTAAGIARTSIDPGWPQGYPLAAAIAANGILQLATISSASQVASAPSSTATPPSSSTLDPTTPQGGQLPAQIRAVEIRLDDDAVLTGSAVKQLMTDVLSSDEDVTLTITEQQNQLREIGAIS